MTASGIPTAIRFYSRMRQVCNAFVYQAILSMLTRFDRPTRPTAGASLYAFVSPRPLSLRAINTGHRSQNTQRLSAVFSLFVSCPVLYRCKREGWTSEKAHLLNRVFSVCCTGNSDQGVLRLCFQPSSGSQPDIPTGSMVPVLNR